MPAKTDIYCYGRHGISLLTDKETEITFTGCGKGNQRNANSLAVFPGNTNRMIVAGGDFAHDEDTTLNCALSHDGTLIHGYVPLLITRLSQLCEVYYNDRLISCGTSGVDVSVDGGMNWKLVAQEVFMFARKRRTAQLYFLQAAMANQSCPGNFEV